MSFIFQSNLKQFTIKVFYNAWSFLLSCELIEVSASDPRGTWRQEEGVREEHVDGARGGTLPKNDYVRSVNRAISCFNKHIYRAALSFFFGNVRCLISVCRRSTGVAVRTSQHRVPSQRKANQLEHSQALETRGERTASRKDRGEGRDTENGQEPDRKADLKVERKNNGEAGRKAETRTIERPIKKGPIQKPLRKIDRKADWGADQKPDPEADHGPGRRADQKPDPGADQAPDRRADQKLDSDVCRKINQRADQKPDPAADRKTDWIAGQKTSPRARGRAVVDLE